MKKRMPSAFSFFLAGMVLASSADAQSTITGTLLGHDHKPLKKCMVLMTVGGAEEKTITIEPDEKGRFHQETNESGLHFINFVGINHRRKTVVLYIDEPREVKLNVRLSLEYYADELSQAEVRGPNAKSPFNGTPLVKQADGTYVAEFPSKDSLVQYLIVKATRSGESVTGTNADDYLIHPYGGMFAVSYGLQKPRNGKVRIVLDPKNPTDNYAEESPFSDDRSLDAEITQIFHEVNDRQKFVAPDRIVLAKLSARIATGKNAFLRQALWIKYLNMLFPNPEFKVATPDHLLDANTISQALDELTPSSPAWMLRWLFPTSLLRNSVNASGQPGRYKDYAERSVESWPYNIRGWGYRELIGDAARKGDAAESDRLYQKLLELSPESPAAKYEQLQRERKTSAKVISGAEVPRFEAHALEDTSVVYTPDNINATVYLIDFWATWCGPCIQEFPYLHTAYEQFHEKGFEILSYSVDASREVVTRFRKEKFPMPWLHAIDPQLRATEGKMAKQMEVYFYPTTLLVDSSGKIIATTEELRDEKLTELLKKLLRDP